MARTPTLLLLSVLILSLAACTTSGRKHRAADDSSAVETGPEVLYTQFNLWVERGRHVTTNYQVGRMVPVNSAVVVDDSEPRNPSIALAHGSRITVQVVDSGESFRMKNEKRYTHLDRAGVVARYFGPDPVDLSRFTGKSREAIRKGMIVTGMSKDAVLVSRGYPPAHRTPSLDRNAWRYWRSRHDTILVYFEDGRVARIRD